MKCEYCTVVPATASVFHKIRGKTLSVCPHCMTSLVRSGLADPSTAIYGEQSTSHSLRERVSRAAGHADDCKCGYCRETLDLADPPEFGDKLSLVTEDVDSVLDQWLLEHKGVPLPTEEEVTYELRLSALEEWERLRSTSVGG